MAKLTADRLRLLFDYDPVTGVFIRKVANCNRVRVGDVVGSTKTSGHLTARIDGHSYALHRLAWLHVHGQWPSSDLDHINGQPADNRLCNLREATDAQNNANARKRKDNSSGFKGVYWNKKLGRWQAYIFKDRRKRHLGYFDSAAEGGAAYAAAAHKLNGEFARTE